MSDEFKNINDIDNEPEKGAENSMGNSRDDAYTKGESFVMRNPEETEKKAEEPRQTSQEPQEAPSEENPYTLILIGRPLSPEEKAPADLQKSLPLIRRKKKREVKKTNIVLTSLHLPFLRNGKKRRKKEMVPALQENLDLQQPVQQCSAWWQVLCSRA